MWHTSQGDRKIEGAERRLLILGATQLADDFEQFNQVGFEFGAAILDFIQSKDLVPLIFQVLRQLLDNSPVPELLAWNEALIYEMYGGINVLLDYEIDDQGFHGPKKEHFFIRQAILDALKKEDDDDPLPLPKLKSKARRQWHDEIEYLSENILWDHDFLTYEEFADIHPDRAAAIKEFAGIDKEYYAATPNPIGEKERAELEVFRKGLEVEIKGWREHHKKTGKLV